MVINSLDSQARKYVAMLGYFFLLILYNKCADLRPCRLLKLVYEENEMKYEMIL